MERLNDNIGQDKSNQKIILCPQFLERKQEKGSGRWVVHVSLSQKYDTKPTTSLFKGRNSTNRASLTSHRLRIIVISVANQSRLIISMSKGLSEIP